MTPQQRTAIYSLAAVIGTALGSVGVVTDTQWAQVTALITAMVAVYTAFAHRPTKG